MKYYGKITSDKDLVTKEKSTEIASTQIAAAISNPSGAIKTELDKKANAPTVFTGTLSAGDTSITFPASGTSTAITTSSIIDVYTDTYGIAPKTVVASAGSVTMTFKAQESDLGIRLEVR